MKKADSYKMAWQVDQENPDVFRLGGVGGPILTKEEIRKLAALMPEVHWITVVFGDNSVFSKSKKVRFGD